MTNSLPSENHKNKVKSSLGDVFCDLKTHLEVADIIQNHKSNRQDIREIALAELNLSKVKSIIDLGCGFGFFTRGLVGKVKKNTKIIGVDRHVKCKQFYLDSCKHAELKGQFISGGIGEIKSIKENSIDLVICSYALYFFPEYLEDIARILKSDGTFVAITHSYPHMVEFTTYVKTILHGAGFYSGNNLPYEELIKGFSNVNGVELLSKWFGTIKSEKITSSLVFNYDDYHCFEKYFRFKKSFFIPPNITNEDVQCEVILESLKNDMKLQSKIEISKKDIIFICQKPT